VFAATHAEAKGEIVRDQDAGAGTEAGRRSLPEYVPGASGLPALRAWWTTGDFVSGTRRDAFVLEPGTDGKPPLRVAPSICVEGLQGGWFNPLVRAGAGLLVNITDDGWLAGSPGPELHLQLARMRSVETRRWLVRASNSGISAVIDPQGAIVASLPFGEAGTLMQAVQPSEQLTPYVRFGDWVVWVSLAIVGMALCAAVRGVSR
jgi:apolipoprotein N-acyltransferase